jgi:hypothetical protein
VLNAKQILLWTTSIDHHHFRNKKAEAQELAANELVAVEVLLNHQEQVENNFQVKVKWKIWVLMAIATIQVKLQREAKNNHSLTYSSNPIALSKGKWLKVARILQI